MNRQISLEQLASLPVTYRHEVPEHYRDEMGHMNVMWYTHLFSQSFGKFGDQFGLNEAYFRAHERGSFALECHFRFLAEVHIGRHITVRTRLLGRSPKRLHFMHFMTIDESGALAATQENVSAHIDMRIRRMCPLPDDIAERFDRILAEQNQLPWPAPACGVMKP